MSKPDFEPATSSDHFLKKLIVGSLISSLRHTSHLPNGHGKPYFERGALEKDVYVTGNTVIDAVNEVALREYDWRTGPLSGLPLNGRLVLITAHRRESFGEPFRELCLAIRELAHLFDGEGVQFVYPVHLNPNVRRPVSDILSGLSNVSLIEPLDYLSLVQLLRRSTVVLTDSGGYRKRRQDYVFRC